MDEDTVVAEQHCISEKPSSKVDCFMGNCPKWVEGPFGSVSLKNCKSSDLYKSQIIFAPLKDLRSSIEPIVDDLSGCKALYEPRHEKTGYLHMRKQRR